MNVTWLGWAGVELEVEGETLVIDPMQDAGAVFAAYGELAAGLNLPEVVAPRNGGRALAGLVSHLHRDHADADALRAALAPDATVLVPRAGGGGPLEELATAQASAELDAAGLRLEEVEPWSARDIGPFRVTAVPAVDGSGDPQVSWIVEAGGRRLFHGGDTIWHGFWWRMVHRLGAIDLALLPVNGAAVSFPHRQPASGLPAAMTPEHAAAAAAALQRSWPSRSTSVGTTSPRTTRRWATRRSGSGAPAPNAGLRAGCSGSARASTSPSRRRVHVRAGARHLVLRLADDDPAAALEILGCEVLPLVRRIGEELS